MTDNKNNEQIDYLEAMDLYLEFSANEIEPDEEAHEAAEVTASEIDDNQSEIPELYRPLSVFDAIAPYDIETIRVTILSLIANSNLASKVKDKDKEDFLAGSGELVINASIDELDPSCDLFNELDIVLQYGVSFKGGK